MLTVTMYLLYLATSIAVTIWVAKTLFQNGRVFLVQAFDGDETIADSVNHLLVVGFYLINIGYIALALRYGERPTDAAEVIELFSMKVGLVLIVLGAMHFFNLWALSKVRKRTEERRMLEGEPANYR